MSDSFATLWAVARHIPLFMGFFRQEYWSGLPCPLPGDLPDPGIELVSLMSPALAGKFFTTRESPSLVHSEYPSSNPDTKLTNLKSFFH